MASRRDLEKKKLRYQSARERAEKHEKKFDPTAVAIPDGFERFSFTKERTYRLDILGYVVGKGNPFADEGFIHYERTFFIHNVPTPEGNRAYCCLAKTFKKNCPICEELAKLERSGGLDEDGVKKMSPKERQLFNVIDLDEKDKGVQVFEFNFWEFGRHLDEKVKAKEKYEGFYHLTGGRTLEVTVQQAKFEGRIRYKPAEGSFEFEEREDYDEDMLDKVCCLDEVPKEMPYAELKAIFLQTSQKPDVEDEDEVEDEEEDSEDNEEEDEEEPAPRAKGKKEPTAKDLKLKEGDWVEYEEQNMTITRISGDGTSLTLEDPDGDLLKAIAPSAVKKIKVKDEEESPSRKGGGKSSSKASSPRSKVKDEEEEDEELEDEDEEEDWGDEEDEEEDDEDEEDEEELEEEDEGPVAKHKKKRGKK